MVAFLGFGLFQLLLGQNTISGHIVDATTSIGIPFTNLGIVSKGEGTVSDKDGVFTLVYTHPNDEVTISAIGFESRSLSLEALSELEQIGLQPIVYETAWVEVSAERIGGEEKIYGVRNRNRGLSIGFGNAQLGTEIGAPIRIKKPSWIKSANFVLNHAKGDSLLLRVNIYKFDKGEVGPNILQENIVIEQEQRRGTITVDLQPYNLILEQDVLLSLEWLRNFDETGNKDITFDTKGGGRLKGTYYRFYSNGAFQKMDAIGPRKPCFYFIGRELD